MASTLTPAPEAGSLPEPTPDPKPPSRWPIFCFGIFGYLYTRSVCRKRGIDAKPYTRLLLVLLGSVFAAFVLLAVASLVLLGSSANHPVTLQPDGTPITAQPETSVTAFVPTTVVDRSGWPILQDGTHAHRLTNGDLNKLAYKQLNLSDANACEGSPVFAAIYDIRDGYGNVLQANDVPQGDSGEVFYRFVGTNNHVYQLQYEVIDTDGRWKLSRCINSV